MVILRKPQDEKQRESDIGGVKDNGEKDIITIPAKKVVTALLNELEEFPVNPALGEAASDSRKDLRLFLNNLSTGAESEKWVTLGTPDQYGLSPPREEHLTAKVVSPNSFQILQGIREEGEIVEGDEFGGGEYQAIISKMNVEDKVGRRKAGQGTCHRDKGR